MTWYSHTETHLNSLPLARNNTDPIRIAASPTNVYVVYRGTNNRLKLGELAADGRSVTLQIGELFTNNTARCLGLTWDPTIAALRALIQVGSTQFLYRVDPTSGQATGVIQLPSGSLYTGLAKRGDQLITQGAGNTELFNITLTGVSASVARISGTSPVTGASQRGMVAHGANNLLLLDNNGGVYNLNLQFGTGSNVSWPAPGSNYSGIGVFGNNIIMGRATDTSLGLGNTYLLRNSALERVGSTDYTGVGTVVPVAKRDDHHVYVIFGNTLYLWNQGSGTRRAIGTTQSGITCLVWANSTLYGIGNNRIYTINTDTAAATAGAALRTPFTPIAGGANDAARILVWNAAGSVQNLHLTSGLLSSVLSLGNNRGGFYEGGKYYTVDPNGNVRVKGSSQSDAQTLLLDPASIPDSRFAGGVFEINGQLFMFAVRSGNARSIKYSGLFPEFYRRGSIINLLTVPDVPNRELGSGYSSTTYIMPAATGGKGPFTYAIHRDGAAQLPTGFSFNSTSRALTVATGVTPGRYNLEYLVTDSESPSQSVSQAFEVAVDAPAVQPVGLLNLADQTLSVQGDSSHTVPLAAATGGTLPYAYELGTLSGTPPSPPTSWAAPSSFTVPSNQTVDFVQDVYNPDVMWQFSSRVVRHIDSTSRVVQFTLKRLTKSTNTVQDITVPSFTATAANNLLLAYHEMVQVGPNRFVTGGERSGGGNQLRQYWQTMTVSGNSATLGGTGHESASATHPAYNPSGTQSTGERGSNTTVLINGSPYLASIWHQTNTEFGSDKHLQLTALNNMGPTGGSVRMTIPVATLRTRQAQGFDHLEGERVLEVIGNKLYFATSEINTDTNVSYTKVYSITLPSPLASGSRTPSSVSAGEIHRTAHPLWPGSFSVDADQSFVLGFGTSWYRFRSVGRVADTRTIDGTLPEGFNFEPSINTVEVDSHAAAGTYTWGHKVTDGANRTAYGTTRLTVNAVAYPTLTVPGASFSVTKASTGRVTLDLPEASGGRAPYSYTLTHLSGVTLVTQGARQQIIVDRNDVAEGTHELTYTATDSRGVTATSTITLHANARIALVKPPNITLGADTPSTVYNLPTATGGSGNYNYTISGLPAGASAQLGGATPAITASHRVAVGAYTVQFTATDRADSTNTVTQSFTITRVRLVLTFAAAVAGRTIYPQADGSTPNVVITLPGVTNGSSPYTYKLLDEGGEAYGPTEAGGVTWVAATRTLTLNPDEMSEGPAIFDYEAVDNNGATGSLRFTITVGERLQLGKPADIAISDTTDETTVRLPVATGGSGNYSYTITGAPTNFTTANTPPTIRYGNTVPRGNYRVDYTVTDTTSNDTVTQSFTVTSTVSPTLPLILPAPPTIIQTGLITQRRILPAARGGKAPYIYSVTGAPAGVTFDRVSRTLRVAKTVPVGNYNLIYSVTDSEVPAAKSVSRTFLLRVIPLEAIVQLQLPRTLGLNFVRGTAATKDMAAAIGGTPPYTYELTLADGRTLPEGLTFNAAANQLSVASDTPLGKFTFKHKVTDSSAPNVTAEQLLRVNVTAAPLTYLPVTLPSISLILHDLGTEQTVTLPEAAGGDGHFAYRMVREDGSTFPWGYKLRGRQLTIDADIPVGEVRFLYQATDGQGTTTSVPFRVLSVDKELLASAVTTSPVEIGCEPVIVSRITPSDGVAPYSYEIRGGEGHFAVYDGDVIASKDTPAGRYDLEVEVTDAGAGDVDLTLRTIVVTRSAEACPILEPLPEAGDTLVIPDLQTNFTTFAGVAFDLQLAQVAGARYKLERLPEGLSFDQATQVLSGTLQAPGDYSFAYIVTDEEGKRAVVEYDIVNQTPLDEQTRFSARYVHLQREIQSLYDSELPLEFDVSFMAIYKNSVQVQAQFVESGGKTVTLVDWQTANRGNFALRQTGGVSTVSLDPRVVGELLNLLQEGRSGIFVFNIRTRLEPGEHAAVFPSDNIPSQALEDEFTRLDIQDHSKAQQLEPGELVAERQHIANEAVGTDQLAEQAVRQQSLAHAAVKEEHIEDLSITAAKLDGITSDSIESTSVDAGEIADGAITKDKLSGAMITEVSRFDDQAVTTEKLKDGDLQGRDMATFSAINTKFKGQSITGDKIPKGTLRKDVHLGEELDPSVFARQEIANSKIQDGAVRPKHLVRGLRNRTGPSRPAAQLRVANPLNIPAGTPVGVKLVDGVPTVYRLRSGGFDES